MEARGARLLLLGIDVSIFGVILALTTSGSSGALAVIVGLLGLAICAGGMLTAARP